MASSMSMNDVGDVMGDIEVDMPPPKRRSFCTQCKRAASVCLCPHLPKPKVVSKVHVVIIMHPKELKRKCTTGLLAKLGLEYCDILVGRDFELILEERVCEDDDFNGHREILKQALVSGARTCVLFPCEGAIDLSSRNSNAANQARLFDNIDYMIVFDGTWQFAREMYEKNRRHQSECTKVGNQLITIHT
jgi:DTW domain-containing protein